MIEIFVGLIAISLIAAFLALLLEIADRYIADYGEKHILVNEEKDLVVQGGRPLLFSLAEKGIFLPSACGGKGTCAYCKAKVLEGGGPVLPTETPYLSKEELDQHVRITCQLKVKDDLKVQIPEELFLVKAFQVKVERIDTLSPDVKGVQFSIQSPEEGITFRPGQYVQLEIPKYERTKESEFRAYSISSSADEHHKVDLLITKVPEGDVSTYVHDYMKSGEQLTIRGPFGEFYLRNSDRDILMIATGSGLAPIYSMIKQICKEGNSRKVTLFFGDKKPADLLYYDELRELDRTFDNFTYIPTVSRATEEDNWQGERGRVTDLIKKYIPDNAQIDVYICGIPAMVESCHELLIQKGVPQVRMWYDKFE